MLRPNSPLEQPFCGKNTLPYYRSLNHNVQYTPMVFVITLPYYRSPSHNAKRQHKDVNSLKTPIITHHHEGNIKKTYYHSPLKTVIMLKNHNDITPKGYFAS